MAVASVVFALAYLLFKMKYYHLHEEYLASLPARGQSARGQVPGMNRPNASEKVDPFPGRLVFFDAFLLFFVCFVWL